MINSFPNAQQLHQRAPLRYFSLNLPKTDASCPHVFAIGHSNLLHLTFHQEAGRPPVFILAVLNLHAEWDAPFDMAPGLWQAARIENAEPETPSPVTPPPIYQLHGQEMRPPFFRWCDNVCARVPRRPPAEP